ncbi:StAR-related lipid transfer protein 13 [Acromyrmex echinatior]|uniref:StAR-related lipid transfer protein 13 n=1 Tax=Acromyrmex echinatior TaxID=103372 RepID=F4X3X8_ACREC|nr:StAR-related lipid transfer protein 13 [Acromyrmex echinatior]
MVQLGKRQDYQFPIDVSGVAKDHPFLEADSLQSLFRRLHALNRCANMKLDTHHTHHSTSHGKSVSTRRITRYEARTGSVMQTRGYAKMRRSISMRVQLILLELSPILLLSTFAFYVIFVLKRFAGITSISLLLRYFLPYFSVNLFFFPSQFLSFQILIASFERSLENFPIDGEI